MRGGLPEVRVLSEDIDESEAEVSDGDDDDGVEAVAAAGVATEAGTRVHDPAKDAAFNRALFPGLRFAASDPFEADGSRSGAGAGGTAPQRSSRPAPPPPRQGQAVRGQATGKAARQAEPVPELPRGPSVSATPSPDFSFDSVTLDQVYDAVLDELREASGIRLSVTRHDQRKFGREPAVSIPTSGPNKGQPPQPGCIRSLHTRRVPSAFSLLRCACLLCCSGFAVQLLRLDTRHLCCAFCRRAKCQHSMSSEGEEPAGPVAAPVVAPVAAPVAAPDAPVAPAAPVAPVAQDALPGLDKKTTKKVYEVSVGSTLCRVRCKLVVMSVHDCSACIVCVCACSRPRGLSSHATSEAG